MTDAIWQLPGPSAFLERSSAALREGRSVVLLCPNEATPPDLLTELAGSIETDRTSVLVRDGWLPEDQGEDPQTSAGLIAHALFNELGLPLPPPGDTNGFSLASAPGAESLTLLIEARTASNQMQQALVLLATEVADAMKDVGAWRRFALCIAAAPTAGQRVPQPDVALAVRWWWGVLRPLDVELALEGIKVLDPCMTRSAIELATWDVQLADAIARSWSGKLAALDEEIAALVPLAADSSHQLDGDGGRAGRRPSEPLLEAWRAGLVEAWEGSVRWHLSAHLARNQPTARQRVWLAQVKELFPIVEIERTRLTSWLTEAAARSGAPPQVTVDGDQVDLADLEIGQVVRYLGRNREVPVPKGRMELIRSIRDLRNSLAHREPVDLKTVLDLRQRVSSDRV